MGRDQEVDRHLLAARIQTDAERQLFGYPVNLSSTTMVKEDAWGHWDEELPSDYASDLGDSGRQAPRLTKSQKKRQRRREGEKRRDERLKVEVEKVSDIPTLRSNIY